MVADVLTSLKNWSATEGGNQPTGSANVGPNLDDNLRQIQATVRTESATRTTIAAATTTDLNTVDAGAVDITGSGVSISSLGTVSAGIRKHVRTLGSVTFVHSSSLDCLGSANVTTAAGEQMVWESTGTGWFMVSHTRDAVLPALTSNGYLRNTGGVLDWAAAAVSLSSITAATTNSSLSNGTSQITWDYGTSGGLKITAAGGTGSGTLFDVEGNRTQLFRVARSADGSYSALPQLSVTGAGRFVWNGGSKNSAGEYVQIIAQSGTSSASGGYVQIYGGASGSGVAGDVGVQGGSCTSGTGGSVDIAGGSAGSGSGGSVTISAGTGTTENGTVSISTTRAKFTLQGAKPTVSSGGGAGATVEGCDNAFTVTFGTGSPTSVVIGFVTTKSIAPIAVCSGSQSGQVLSISTSTTGITISSSTAFSSGTTVHCIVIDRVV